MPTDSFKFKDFYPNRVWIIPILPFIAAQSSGILPCLSLAVTSAPFSMRYRTRLALSVVLCGSNSKYYIWYGVEIKVNYPTWLHSEGVSILHRLFYKFQLRFQWAFEQGWYFLNTIDNCSINKTAELNFDYWIEVLNKIGSIVRNGISTFYIILYAKRSILIEQLPFWAAEWSAVFPP